MSIFSYSERGIVNSLFYEIRYSPEPEAFLADLLSRVRFPFTDAPSVHILEATVLIEQSFSEFGTADALALLTTDKGDISVFIEAKVGTTWSIQKEFQAFVEGTTKKISSSNLFTQLYHKVRLVAALHRGGINSLAKGIEFPPCSTNRRRSIGTNPVVRRAVKMLEEHLDGTYYIALLPDKPDELNNFFEGLLGWPHPDDFVEWDVRNYGYLSWSDIEQFCIANNLKDTLNVFAFNKGQIYGHEQDG